MSEHPEHQSKQERKWKVYVTDDGSIALEPGSHNDRKPITVVESDASKQERDGTCKLCGKQTDSLAGNPGHWPLHFPDPTKGNGISKSWHMECVMRLVRAALSDVTEQKDLGDKPELLGQTREETDHHSGGLR